MVSGTTDQGKNTRLKLGSYPAMSLSDAREKARQLIAGIEDGSYFDKPDEVMTLGELIGNFIDIYAKNHRRDWKRTQALLGKFKRLYDRPVTEIKRADIVRVTDGLIASGLSTGANRAVASMKIVMNWAVDRGVIDASPLSGMRLPVKKIPRERVLTDDELRAVWEASTAEGYPFGDILKVLITTGQRRAEVSGMRWSEIDFAAGTWTLPGNRVKNASIHTVSLPPVTLEIFRQAPRYLKSDFVFTITGKSAFSGFGRAKERIDRHLNFDEPWRLHDLRRTMATKMAELRVPPHVIEAVLNHRSGIVSGVAATYNRHAYFDEKKEALERWSEHLCQLTQSIEAPTGNAFSDITKATMKSV